MDVSELFSLTQWIEREIKTQQIPQRYQALHNILLSNSRPNTGKQPFEDQKNDLIQAIANVPLESLTTQQLDFLRKMEIGDYVGEDAVKMVEDILFRNSIDVATAAQKFAEIIQNINQGVEVSDQINESLEGVVEPSPIVEGKIIVRVTFSHHAAITNVVDLKRWSSIWHDIGRGVAMINDTSPEAIEVIGAGRGSIVIELAVTYGIAKTISRIMLEALSVAEKVVDIQKKAEEVRGMKLANSKIAKGLDEEAVKEREKGIAAITEKVSKHKSKKGTTEGDKVNALDKSVKDLVDFLEKGGAVDCVLPPEENDTDEHPAPKEIKELRIAFKEIRKLELHIKQLEDKKKDSEPSA